VKGVFVATVTPMSRGGDAIDLGCVGPLLSFFESKGVNGIVPLGTTGEFASISHMEKIDLISECASTKGKLKMIVGCGSSSLSEVIDLIKFAKKKNADAVLVPPPYYFRTAAAKGIESFFDVVLANAELPVLLYHIPSVTGIPIDHDMLERLSKHETLWGIKDTGGKLSQTSEFLSKKPGRVLLGSDTEMLSGLRAGVSGIISACANVVPELLTLIYAGFLEGKDVELYQSRLSEVRGALRNFPLHAALKCWLKLRGHDAGFVRPPLINLTQKEEEDLQVLALRYGDRAENAARHVGRAS